MPYHVYLLASRRHGTLYLGVTNDLSRRVPEHKAKAVRGFSAKYDVSRLVWYEAYERIDEAITRKSAQEVAARLEAKRSPEPINTMAETRAQRVRCAFV